MEKFSAKGERMQRDGILYSNLLKRCNLKLNCDLVAIRLQFSRNIEVLIRIGFIVDN